MAASWPWNPLIASKVAAMPVSTFLHSAWHLPWFNVKLTVFLVFKDDVNDSEDSASLPGDLKPAPARKTHPVKATFRAGQRRASPTAKNFGGKAKLPIISGESTKLAHDKSSSVSSQVSIHPDGSTPPASASPAEVTPSDLLKEEEVLKENISGLRQQIALLETSSQDNQSQLQTELDDCKARKRDEEHHRTDLKAKARKLEESKRKAEVQYAEAERRHASAKSNKIKYTDKIERMKAELARLDRKEADFISKQTKSQAHREQRETELAPILESKKADMADRESAVAALVAKVETLEGEIEYHKTELSHRRERALRRSHSQRQFLPAHFVPVIANPEQMSPTSQQWASFPASTQPVTAPVNTTSPLAYNAVRGSPVSASETPSFFDHPRVRQLDREEIPSKLPSRASSLRQPSEDAPGNALPTFAPFGPPVRTESDPTAGHRRAHSPTASSAAAAASAKNVSLPFFVGGGLTSLDGSDTPSGPATNESPRSPTTPHQNSLIPAHLFDMLDNDEDVVIPQTPMEVALPPRHNIWADDAVQDAFNRAGSPKGTSSAAAVADEDLSLDRIRSHDSSRASSLYSVPSAPLHKEPLGRHPLALNPGAKAFSPDAVSTNGNASVSDPSLHAQPVRRSLFGSTSLRDVWSRASNKTDHRSAAATAALFDADDIFSPVNHQTQQDGANHH